MMRRASSATSSVLLGPAWRMANSSPPNRATVSVSRRHVPTRSATLRSKRSPIGWPSVSLTVLKRSRSRHSTAAIAPCPTCATICPSRSTKAARFASPVSGSCRARNTTRASACRRAVMSSNVATKPPPGSATRRTSSIAPAVRLTGTHRIAGRLPHARAGTALAGWPRRARRIATNDGRDVISPAGKSSSSSARALHTATVPAASTISRPWSIAASVISSSPDAACSLAAVRVSSKLRAPSAPGATAATGGTGAAPPAAAAARCRRRPPCRRRSPRLRSPARQSHWLGQADIHHQRIIGQRPHRDQPFHAIEIAGRG